MNFTSQAHQRFMELALLEAERALAAGEFPVGCVVVRRGTVIASGARTNSGVGGNELDHAEMVALRSLVEEKTLPDLSEVVVYSTMEPCLMCYATLILNGVRTIVYGYEDVMGGGSKLDLGSLPPLYASMEVTLVPGVCRNESLRLFKRFFADDKNNYWRESLLAKHTLGQPDD